MLHSAINTDGVPDQNKIPGTVGGKELHFCVLFNLILRARESQQQTIDILKAYNYVPKAVRLAHLGVPVFYRSRQGLHRLHFLPAER